MAEGRKLMQDEKGSLPRQSRTDQLNNQNIASIVLSYSNPLELKKFATVNKKWELIKKELSGRFLSEDPESPKDKEYYAFINLLTSFHGLSYGFSDQDCDILKNAAKSGHVRSHYYLGKLYSEFFLKAGGDIKVEKQKENLKTSSDFYIRILYYDELTEKGILKKDSESIKVIYGDILYEMASLIEDEKLKIAKDNPVFFKNLTECDLILTEQPPDLKNMDSLPVECDTAYVRCPPHGLFYVDKSKNTCIPVTCEGSVLNELDNAVQSRPVARILTGSQLATIQNITGHHPTNSDALQDRIIQSSFLYRRVLDIDPKHPGALTRLADQILQGKIKARLKDFVDCEEIPTSPIQQAAFLYQKALKKDPYYVHALHGLSQLIGNRDIEPYSLQLEIKMTSPMYLLAWQKALFLQAMGDTFYGKKLFHCENEKLTLWRSHLLQDIEAEKKIDQPQPLSTQERVYKTVFQNDYGFFSNLTEKQRRNFSSKINQGQTFFPELWGIVNPDELNCLERLAKVSDFDRATKLVAGFIKSENRSEIINAVSPFSKKSKVCLYTTVFLCLATTGISAYLLLDPYAKDFRVAGIAIAVLAVTILLGWKIRQQIEQKIDEVIAEIVTSVSELVPFSPKPIPELKEPWNSDLKERLMPLITGLG